MLSLLLCYVGVLFDVFYLDFEFGFYVEIVGFVVVDVEVVVFEFYFGIGVVDFMFEYWMLYVFECVDF